MVTKEEINGYFLEAIRRLKAEGYSQKDIVKSAGLSQNAISKIKAGQNNAGDDTINKLCTAFNLNPDFFYRGSTQFTKEAKMQKQSAVHDSELVQELRNRIADKDELIASLKREARTKDELVTQLQARIADLERQLTMGDLTRYPFTHSPTEHDERQQQSQL